MWKVAIFISSISLMANDFKSLSHLVLERYRDVTDRDVVLGTCTCTRVVLEYHFKVLVFVLVALVLATSLD